MFLKKKKLFENINNLFIKSIYNDNKKLVHYFLTSSYLNFKILTKETYKSIKLSTNIFNIEIFNIINFINRNVYSKLFIYNFINTSWKFYYSKHLTWSYKKIFLYSSNFFIQQLRFLLPIIYKMYYYRLIFLFCNGREINKQMYIYFSNKYKCFYMLDGWLNGLFTNFNICYNKLYELEKRYLLSAKVSIKNTFLYYKSNFFLKNKLRGIVGMRSLPDLIFLMSYNRFEEMSPFVLEATKSMLPIVCILNTESDPRGITYPLLGNPKSSYFGELYLILFSHILDQAIKKRIFDYNI